MAISSVTRLPASPAQQSDAASVAAIIDERGKEVPITEQMIRDACARLERHWHYPSPCHAQAR